MTGLTGSAVIEADVATYGHIIDGSETVSADAYIERSSPATAQVVSRYTKGDVSTAAAAVAAARRAFDEGPWPRMTGMERGALLIRLADLLEDDVEAVARIEADEVGKPLRLARNDVRATAGMTRYAGGLAMSNHGDVHTNLGPDFTALVVREPAGVAGLITPWNFPLLLLGQKLPFALAAGCTAVVKPSALTSGTTVVMARLCKRAGIPDGVVNVVLGSGSTVGHHLATSKDVDILSFTGSTEVGRGIVEASQGSLKRVSLELGGKSANIVFADADLDDAVDGVLFGFLFNNGECCVQGSRLLVQDTIADEFLARVVNRVSRLRVGDPLDDATDIGPMIHKEHLDSVLGHVATARDHGGTVLTGGVQLNDGELAAGHFVAPTVVDHVTPENPLFNHEVFGPVLAVIRFRDLDEAVRTANMVDYGLANSVWSKSLDTALQVSRALRSGTVWVNTTIDGSPQLPAGGVKQSGYGREMGQAGFDEFTELKTIQIRTGKRTPFFD